MGATKQFLLDSYIFALITTFLPLLSWSHLKLHFDTVNPENFANSVKRHICDAKNSRLGHDLHISVKDTVISAFRKELIFTKLSICEVSRK